MLELAAQGQTDREIAQSLGISPDTVSGHWKKLRLLYGASSRTEIVAKFLDGMHGRSQEDQKAKLDSLNEELESLRQQLQDTQQLLTQRNERIAQLYAELEQTRAKSCEYEAEIAQIVSVLGEYRVVISRGECGKSWRKYWMCDSIRALGFTPQQFLSGEVSPFTVLLPEDIMSSLHELEQLPVEPCRKLVSYRIVDQEGETRIFVDLINTDGILADGVGQCRILSIDMTDWIPEFMNKIERGWPTFPLHDPV